MSEPYDHLLEAYARLVVRVGINVQLGQRVVVRGMVEHAEVARAVAAEAYRVGASHVSIEYVDQHLQRAHVDLAPEDSLGTSLQHEVDAIKAWKDDDVAVIALTGNPNPTLMDGADPARLAASLPVERAKAAMQVLGADHVAWSVVAAPNAGWAESIFGTPDVERLWQSVALATRLDEDDPVVSWQQHLAKLARRRDLLNERGFDRMRFRGPGTELEVGLAPRSRWVTAEHTNDAGTSFVANLPTEEVYTSPDWRRADGTLSTTAPFFLQQMNVLVDGLVLELGDGAVRAAKAATGEEAVHHQLDSVPRARHLGEVAIVDGDSRVRRTQLTYRDMLYDENAASHVAWGAGFPTTIEGGTELDVQQRIEAGVNQSATHVDVVVGSPDVEVHGIAADGTTTPVLVGDEFVLG
jgi:aminopeptidase